MIDAIFDDIVNNGLVLIMLGAFLFCPAALNELLNALVDQDFSEFVSCSANAELLS